MKNIITTVTSTKILVGNMDAGYFGIVPNSELFTGTELANLIGLTAGTLESNVDNINWLKFAIDGKIIFKAMGRFKRNISWDQINNVGAVTGSKIVEKNGLKFKVRLMRGASTLTVGSGSSAVTSTELNQAAHGSEWNRLMLPIHVNAGNGSWSSHPAVESNLQNWGVNFTDTDLGMGGLLHQWCCESDKLNSSSKVYRTGNIAGINTAAYNRIDVNCGWSPVLEMVNTVPTITPLTTPNGVHATKPLFKYTVRDVDGDTMTITESIDGIVFNTHTAVASDTQLTFIPTDLAWLRTRINQTVNITIKVDDGNGGITIVNYPITRIISGINFKLKTPFVTDIASRRILMKLDGNIPATAIQTIEVCNNAFDTSPTWENATTMCSRGLPYPFQNKVKTATKWGVSFRVKIERGTSLEEIYLDGIGGAFD